MTLFFVPLRPKDRFSFVAGQFVMVFLPACGARGRAYTLTSLPNEPEVAVTVKKMGPFSTALCALRVGARVTMKGPYGRFFPTAPMKKLAFFAGGIGIAPFYTLLRHEVAHGGKRTVVLFYSNRRARDIAFRDALGALAEKLPRAAVVYAVTGEKPRVFSCETRRIDAPMIREYAHTLNGRYCFLCGSTEFIHGIRKTLARLGVPEKRIITETFF